MMEFVKEIHEARLIRTRDDLKDSYSRVCENLYTVVLTLDFLSRIQEGRNIAERYAQTTASYINYTEFRTSATDLYNLIYFVQESPDTIQLLFGSEDSARLREKTHLPRMELNRWLLRVKDPNSRSIYFFMRMEQALNINDSILKDVRRMLANKNPSNSDLSVISYKILQLYRHRMALFDLKPEIERVLGQGKYTYIY